MTSTTAKQTSQDNRFVRVGALWTPEKKGKRNHPMSRKLPVPKLLYGDVIRHLHPSAREHYRPRCGASDRESPIAGAVGTNQGTRNIGGEGQTRIGKEIHAMAETDARFLEILNEEIQEYEGYENGMVVRDLLGQRDSYAIDHGEREDTEPLSDTQIETLKKIIEDVKGTATARWEAEKARATYST